MSDNLAAHHVVRRDQLLIVLLSVWLVITGVAFGLRVASVVRARDLISATGMEAMPTYGVWKARNGLPVYEDPFRWAYPSNLYNYGFYKLYGWAVALTGRNGADVVLPVRAVTFGLSLIGVLGLVCAAGEIAKPVAKPRAAGRVVRFVVIGLAAQTFYSSNFTSWWSLGIRPDVGAVAILAWGWFFLLRGIRRRSLAHFFAAGVMFYFNWCFKQTSVLTLAAALLYLLVVERWFRAAIVLALTSGILIGVTALLWMRVPHYLDNVIVAPAGNVFSLKVGIFQVVEALGQNPLVFGLPIVFVLFRTRKFLRAEERLPFFVAIILIPPTLIAVARIGGGRNYMFEEYLACTLCAAMLITRGLESDDRLNTRLLRVANILIAASCLFPVAQMILKDRIGRVWVPSDEIRRYRALADFIEQKPGQILVLEDMFAQPWHATAGHYPATVIDVVVYDSASRRGLIKDGGIERVICEKRYPWIIVRKDPLQPNDVAIESGYRDVADPTVNGAGLRYLVRD